MKNYLFSNYDVSEGLKCAKEWLLENDGEERGWKTIDDVPDDEGWREYGRMEGQDWDDFADEMKEFMKYDYFVLAGRFGTWQGTGDGGDVIKDWNDLLEFWEDCDYREIWDEDGHLYIRGSHHDGTHCAELRRITGKGMELVEAYKWNDWDRRRLCTTLMSCNLFSALPRYAEKVWGCKRTRKRKAKAVVQDDRMAARK